MKKFVTAIVSLVLAGSMAFGLAACNDKGGNGGDNSGGNNGGDGNGGGLTGEQVAETLQNAIDATLALPNYTLTESMQASMSVKYNGEVINAETELGMVTIGEGETAMSMPLTGDMLLDGIFDMDEGELVLDETTTSKYDFTNGKIAASDSYWDYEADESVDYISYMEVEGATINIYEKSMDYSTHDVYNKKTEYVGYADNATAKEVLRKSYKTELNSILFDAEYKGTGENSEREGNLLDLLDLFKAEVDGKTYSAKLKSQDELPIDVEIKLTVENGRLTGFNGGVDGDIDFVEYFNSMVGESTGMSIVLNDETDKLTIDVEMNESVELSAIGSTTISIPSEDKVVDDNNVNTQRVLSNKSLYEKMFADRVAVDGTVSLNMDKYNYDDDTDTSENTSFTVTVNEQLGIAKVKESYRKYVDGDRVEETTTTKLYWASDDGMKIYTAEHNDGGYFQGWSEEVVTEAISGSKSEALIAKLPAEIQVYFNLNGRPMAEQFELFEITDYTDLTTEITVNGKKVPIKINYSYYADDEIYLNGYVYGDSWIYVNTGYLNEDGELPEIDTDTVTEEQWKGLVTPWLNSSNVTIRTEQGEALIDIAADGKSGKIYFISNRSNVSSIYAEFAPSTEDEGQLTMTFYSSGYYWNSETETSELVWHKEQVTSESLEILLYYSGLWRYCQPVQNLLRPTFGANYDKSIADIYDEVSYNAMLQMYSFNNYGLSFINGTLIVKESGSETCVLMNCGTTVAGEIPADIVANAVEQ